MSRFHRWRVKSGGRWQEVAGDWLMVTGSFVVVYRGGGDGIEATHAIPIDRGYKIKDMEG